MARPLRIHVPGGFYHVTLRGNHRQPIFYENGDRALLDAIVARSAHRVGARLHAYCWMTNHIHLVVQVSDVPLGKLMLRIASGYARALQSRIETTGHLFERRFHSALIDADAYLLECVRYIHLNPVRAGLIEDPRKYPWSSHHAYLGQPRVAWVTTDYALGMLHERRDKAIDLYKKFMGQGQAVRWGSGTLAPHHNDARILGDDTFVAAMRGTEYRSGSRQSLDDLIAECCNRFDLTPQLLASASRARRLAAARGWVAHQAVQARVASICEVARRFARSEAAIRQLISRHYPGKTGN